MIQEDLVLLGQTLKRFMDDDWNMTWLRCSDQLVLDGSVALTDEETALFARLFPEESK